MDDIWDHRSYRGCVPGLVNLQGSCLKIEFSISIFQECIRNDYTLILQCWQSRLFNIWSKIESCFNFRHGSISQILPISHCQNWYFFSVYLWLTTCNPHHLYIQNPIAFRRRASQGTHTARGPQFGDHWTRWRWQSIRVPRAVANRYAEDNASSACTNKPTDLAKGDLLQACPTVGWLLFFFGWSSDSGCLCGAWMIFSLCGCENYNQALCSCGFTSRNRSCKYALNVESSHLITSGPMAWRR